MTRPSPSARSIVRAIDRRNAILSIYLSTACRFGPVERESFRKMFRTEVVKLDAGFENEGEREENEDEDEIKGTSARLLVRNERGRNGKEIFQRSGLK